MRISDWSSDVCSSDLASTPGKLVVAGDARPIRSVARAPAPAPAAVGLARGDDAESEDECRGDGEACRVAGDEADRGDQQQHETERQQPALPRQDRKSVVEGKSV